MDEGTIGLWGGIVGSSIGILGGIIGTWMSIRKTSPGRQRAFMIKASVLGWVGMLSFLIALFIVPKPWVWVIWILYGPSLAFFIVQTNRGLVHRQGNA